MITVLWICCPILAGAVVGVICCVCCYDGCYFDWGPCYVGAFFGLLASLLFGVPSAFFGLHDGLVFGVSILVGIPIVIAVGAFVPRIWTSYFGYSFHCRIGSVKWAYKVAFDPRYYNGVLQYNDITLVEVLFSCTAAKIVGFERISKGTEVIIPQKCGTWDTAELCENLFMGKDEIEKVDLSDATKLTVIGKRAFYGCSRLSDVLFPNSVKEIGEEAFEHCSGLQNAEWKLSEGHLRESRQDLEHDAPSQFFIGRRAFAGCTCLESFVIPSRCEVGENAFENCINLKSISIPSSLEGKTANWGLPADCSIVVRPIEVNDGSDVGETVDSASDSPELQEAYRLLGVSESDSLEVIRKAYLENLGKASEFLQQNQALAEKMMAEINVAWKTIEEKSATKRA